MVRAHLAATNAPCNVEDEPVQAPAEQDASVAPEATLGVPKAARSKPPAHHLSHAASHIGFGAHAALAPAALELPPAAGERDSTSDDPRTPGSGRRALASHASLGRHSCPDGLGAGLTSEPSVSYATADALEPLANPFFWPEADARLYGDGGAGLLYCAAGALQRMGLAPNARGAPKSQGDATRVRAGGLPGWWLPCGLEAAPSAQLSS
jgi:hypothetical protein